jgi:hypothetical protein
LISLYYLVLFSIFFVPYKVFFPPLFCSFLVVFVGARGARSTLPLSHYGIWGVRPPYPTPVPSKVSNGEPLAGRDSPGIFIMRGYELHWVLSFDNAWVSGREGERESEVRRNKIKKQKVYLPLLHIQGKKKKKSVA